MAESIPISKFKTLDKLRKTRQFRRKAQSDRRKIYALDTEATPQGDMLLLADNDGHKLDLVDLNLESILKFLFHKRYETAWCFFWNLSYDARIFLRIVLPLISKNALLKFYRTGRCKILGYSIQYIEKKKLTIRKGHHSVNFYDIQQFYFQKTLSDAYQSNIGKLSKQYLEMKTKRENFSKEYYRKNRRQVRKYCIQDCIYTKDLSEHWIDLFYEAFGFYPSHWISSGYLAEKVLINNGVDIPTFEQIPEQVQELAWNSYIGGRIELVIRGHVDYACTYDINSAYPYSFTQIPELTKGKWIQSKKILKNSLVGFFKIKCNIPFKHLSPFPFVVKNKVVFPIGEFITFATLAELKACDDSSWYAIIDSWQYVDAKPIYPYKENIQKWYNYRHELKRKGNPLEQPFKVILNSIYGKTGQRVNGKIGNIFNPVIVSTITGISRAMLYRFITEHGIEKDVVMMYTDSITCTRKLDVNSDKLGEFSLDFEGSIYALQSGFYAKNDKWIKSRGIGQIGDDTILHKDTFVDSKGRIKYSFDKIRVGTIKRNILRGTLEKIGKFENQTRELNLNADRGRLWIGRLTDVRLKERNVSTPFNLNIFDYTKI